MSARLKLVLHHHMKIRLTPAYSIKRSLHHRLIPPNRKRVMRGVGHLLVM